MQLNCEGDYELQKEWLDRHHNADLITVDIKSGLPVCAQYFNPIYAAYVEDPRRFFQMVRQELRSWDEPCRICGVPHLPVTIADHAWEPIPETHGDSATSDTGDRQ